MNRCAIALASLLAVTSACAKNAKTTDTTGQKPAAATAAPATKGPDVSLDPSLTVATINGVPITAGQLDEKIAEDLDGATQEYVTKVHDLRKQALEQLVAEKLIKTEADSRGMDDKALMKAEVEDKIKPPTEDELKAMYDRVVKPSRPDVSYEMAKPHLQQQAMQQAARTRFFAYIDELKAKYKASTSLPLPKVARTEVAATGPSKGPQDAKVTIVEFSDFECPFCSRAIESVKEVEKNYGDKVRIVFRNYPLPFHSHAEKAAEAGVCAQDQGKFWEMHDQMFGHQDQLEPDGLKKLARAAGLDGAKFDSCLDSGEKKAQVEHDIEDGKKAHVNGTPAFFINGRSLSGAQPFEAFKEVIDAELAAK